MSKKRVKDRGLCEADENKYVERLSHAARSNRHVGPHRPGLLRALYESPPPRRHVQTIHKSVQVAGRVRRPLRAPCDRRGSTACCSTSRTLSCRFSRSSRSVADHAWNDRRPTGRWAYLPRSSFSLRGLRLTYSVVACQDACKRGDIQITRAIGAYGQRALSWTLPRPCERARAHPRIRAASQSHHLSAPFVLCGTLPILHILTRVTLCTTQVNSQVIRPEEKAMLSRLVNIMVSLELRFVQERAEDGQLLYRLDPWVWGLCSCWSVVADGRQQAGGFIRDIRWQARSGYPPSALCREAPCGHRGQSTLT